MKLIVGLGNPGSEYEKTRHNAGFMALDRLWALRGDQTARPKSRFSGISWELSLGSERCVLLKPTVFMNLSGRSVAEAIGFFKLDPAKELLVIVDDVALPTGTVRIRAGGGAGGHNGLRDIQRALSTQEYPRLRIGVDACPPMMKLEDYVLGRFTAEQQAMLPPALDRAVEAIELFARSGIDAAMNRFNASDEPKGKSKEPSSGEAPKPSLRSNPRPTGSSDRDEQTDNRNNSNNNVSNKDMHPGWLGQSPPLPGGQSEER